jgi:hypothetical protein
MVSFVLVDNDTNAAQSIETIPYRVTAYRLKTRLSGLGSSKNATLTGVL